jgi:hypothetical protein
MAGCYPGGVTQASFDCDMDPHWPARAGASTGAMDRLRKSLASAPRNERAGAGAELCVACENGDHGFPLLGERSDEECPCLCHGRRELQQLLEALSRAANASGGKN